MKRFIHSVAILASLAIAGNLWSSEFSTVIEGRILRIEPSKSIVIEIKKTQSIELGFNDIKTLAVKDPKQLTDGVGVTAIIGGLGGGMGAGLGVVSPPKRLQSSDNKLKNATILGITSAGFSATGRIIFNLLTQKSPTIVYDASSESFKEPTVINLLPIGTKVRIIQKNQINSTLPQPPWGFYFFNNCVKTNHKFFKKWG